MKDRGPQLQPSLLYRIGYKPFVSIFLIVVVFVYSSQLADEERKEKEWLEFRDSIFSSTPKVIPQDDQDPAVPEEPAQGSRR